MNRADLKMAMPARLVGGRWQIIGNMPAAFDWELLDELEQTDLPAGVTGRFDHSYYLFQYAALLPENATIVEIGTRDGLSAVCMAWALRGRGGRVLTIDPGIMSDEDVAARADEFRHGEFVRGDVLRVCKNILTARVEGYVTFIPGTSADVLSRWDGRRIDMLFVDGSHTHPDVVVDCGWMTFVKPGGIAVFDDWMEPVERAVREYIAHKPDWEIVTESTRQEPGCPWKTVLWRRP